MSTTPEFKKVLDDMAYNLAKLAFETKPEIIPSLDNAFRETISKMELPYTLVTFKAIRGGMDMFCAFIDEKGRDEFFEGESCRNAMMMRMYVEYLIGREEEKMKGILDDKKL